MFRSNRFIAGTGVALALALGGGIAHSSVASANVCQDCDPGGTSPVVGPGHPLGPIATVTPGSGGGSGGGGGTGSGGTPPPMRHVEVKLVDVHATTNEDYFGDDEFYAIGATSSGANNVTPFATKEIDIDGGETKSIDQTVFSADLPANAPLDLTILPFDQDAGKILSNLPNVMSKIGLGCKWVSTVWDPYTIFSTCSKLITQGGSLWQWLADNVTDPDDSLGTIGLWWNSVSSVPSGVQHYRVTTSGSDYTIGYQVTSTPV